MTKKSIVLKRAHFIQILSDVEFMVTSLDGIGSAYRSEEALKAALYDFFTDAKVSKKFIAIRRALINAFDKGASRREILSLERKLDKIERWKTRRRVPKRK